MDPRRRNERPKTGVRIVEPKEVNVSLFHGFQHSIRLVQERPLQYASIRSARAVCAISSVVNVDMYPRGCKV